MKRFLTIDVETTTKNKGDWANKNNRLCLVGLQDAYGTLICDVEYTLHPYNEVLEQIQSDIDNHDILVGFNLKFDLHWLRNYGIKFEHKELYDIQTSEFIFSGQSWVYPDLETVSMKYGHGKKVDKIKEYWDSDIDTPDIPYEELAEYLKQDLNITESVYKTHLSMNIPETTKALIKLTNEDLHTIIDMEHNGICYDEEQATLDKEQYNKELNAINEELAMQYPEYPFISWTSGDHVSAILFGGSIKWEQREEIGVYQTGEKIGLPRYKVHKNITHFEKLATPAKGTELKKEGFWSTGEEALNAAKKVSKKGARIITLLNKKAKLDKLVSTYFSNGDEKGLLNLRRKKNWDINKIYGKYDACVTQTGRLASNSPNMQNFTEEVDRLIYSRFEE